MTQDYGIGSVKNQDPQGANHSRTSKTSTPSQKKQRKFQILKAEPLEFDIDFKVASDYKIQGVASTPDVDRQREKILLDAFREAIPLFMKAPFLHVHHTERPVGVVTKAEITDNGLEIEANIFDHCTDIWELILEKSLNKFSIYGVRKAGTFECKLPVNQRTSPCITKAIELWSISVVGNNAVNPNSYLDIVKSYADFYKNDEILIKTEDTNSNLVHTVTDGTHMDEEEKKKKESEEEKAEGSVDDEQAKQAVTDDKDMGLELIKEPTNVSSIMDEIQSMKETLGKLVESDAKVHATMDKGEEDMEDKDKKKEEEVEKCNDMKKAEEPDKKEETVAPVEYIQKADLETIQKAVIDTITKAFDERITKMETTIEEMKKETIQKGGNVVVLMDELKKFNDESPGVGNVKALGA